MDICLRVDDIGLKPHNYEEVDEGLEIARRFHEAMSGAPYIAGIIPTRVDRDGLSWLRSKPTGMTQAIHGYRHAMGMKGEESEFEGMGPGLCIWTLERALKILTMASDFIPPRNALTDILIDACFRQGMIRIWGAPEMGSDPPKPKALEHGHVIGSWYPLYGYLDCYVPDGRAPISATLDAIADRPGAAVAVLHITWEASACPSLDSVRRFVDRHGASLITPEAYLAHE
jgi:hypothetical protein